MGVSFAGGFKNMTSTKVKTEYKVTAIGSDAISHFRGQDATTTSWTDYKGNAPSLGVVNNGSNITIQNFRNGLSAPRFNSGKYFRENSNFFSLNEITCIVVYKFFSYNSTWDFVIGKDPYWGTGWGIELRNGNVGGYLADNGPDNRFPTNTNIEFITALSATASSGTYTSWAAKLSDPISSITTLNGIQNRTYDADPYPFEVGGDGGFYKIDAQIADIIIWDRALSKTEFETEFVELKNKYAI